VALQAAMLRRPREMQDYRKDIADVRKILQPYVLRACPVATGVAITFVPMLSSLNVLSWQAAFRSRAGRQPADLFALSREILTQRRRSYKIVS